MQRISFVPIDFHGCWPREGKCSIGSLRYHDGFGGENLPEKLASRSLKLQCDYPNSLTLSNVGTLSGSKFKFGKRKRNFSSYVSVVDET